MRPLLNFKILIVRSSPPLYWNLHQVPAFQVYCGFTKTKPSSWASGIICAQACKQLVGDCNWRFKILVRQQSCLLCLSKWRLKHQLISNSSQLISYSSQCLNNVWNLSCLLFYCSKNGRNDLPARHSTCKNFWVLSFISLKQSGSWKGSKLTVNNPIRLPRVIQAATQPQWVYIVIHYLWLWELSCQKPTQALYLHVSFAEYWGILFKALNFCFILYWVDGGFV